MTLHDVLDDDSTSFWLRDVIRSGILRDPVDALADAEILVELLRARLEEIQSV